MRSILLLAILCLFAICFTTPQALAQKVGLFLAGRYMMRDHLAPDPPIIAANSKSVFVLRKGVLAKYNADTHLQEGVLELFGKPAEAPKDWLFDDQESATAFRDERAKRLVPATMTVSDTDVQILVGDQYFRVDPATMKLTLTTPITAEGVPPTSTYSYIYTENLPPLVSSGEVSYRVILPPWPDQVQPVYLLAFERATGKALGSAALPNEMQGKMEWEGVAPGPFVKEIYRLMQQTPVTVVPTDDSLLIFRLGMLAKFDNKTLKVTQTISLYPPLPMLKNPQQATEVEKAAFIFARAQRMMPAILALNGKRLSILQGDDYFSIDTGDMTISNKGKVVNTDDIDMDERFNYLAIRGLPMLTALGDTLYLIDGGQIVKIDCVKGEVTTSELPALLMRTLQPEPKPGMNINHFIPKDGDIISLMGLLEKHTDPAGDYWTVLDQNYGEMELAGDKFTEFLGKTENPEFSIVNAFGKYQLAGELAIIDATFVSKMPAISLFGILGTQVKDAKTIWTLKMPIGTEYTLVGDAIKELDKHPKYIGQSLMFTGSFLKEKKDEPLVGKAYLQVNQYVAPQQNILSLPTAFAASANALVITRTGAVVVFDPATLVEKASVDLFPPMPEPTMENAIALQQERNKRLMPPLLSLSDTGIFVGIGSNLFSADLDLKTIKSATAPLGTVSQTGDFYYITGTDFLTAVNTKDVTKQFTLTMPKEMTVRLYPTFEEMYKGNNR